MKNENEKNETIANIEYSVGLLVKDIAVIKNKKAKPAQDALAEIESKMRELLELTFDLL